MGLFDDDDTIRRRREEETRKRREFDDRKRQMETKMRKDKELARKKKKQRLVRETKNKAKKEAKAEKKKQLQLLMNSSVDDILSGAAESKLFGDAQFDPDDYAMTGAKVNRAAVYRSTWGASSTEVHGKLEKIDGAEEKKPDSKISKGIGGSSQVAKFSPFMNKAKGADPSQIAPVTGPPTAEERIATATKFGSNKLKRGGF
jgi:hypothetical protein